MTNMPTNSLVLVNYFKIFMSSNPVYLVQIQYSKAAYCNACVDLTICYVQVDCFF